MPLGRSLTAVAFSAALLIAARAEGQSQAYDAQPAFQLQNPNGLWEYGLYLSSGYAGGFAPTFYDFPNASTTFPTTGVQTWGYQQGPFITKVLNGSDTNWSGGVLSGAKLTMAGGQYIDQYSVVRWTAPAAGDYRVTASLKLLPAAGSCKSNTVSYMVSIKNSVYVHDDLGSYPQQQTTFPSSASYTVPSVPIYHLAQGDRVEVAVGNDGDYPERCHFAAVAMRVENAPTSGNLLANPSFDRVIDMAGWNFDDTTGVTWNSTDSGGASASGSAGFVGVSAGACGEPPQPYLAQSVPVSAGATYSVSAKFKLLSTSGLPAKGFLLVDYYTATQHLPGYIYLPAGLPVGTWQKVSGSFTAPPGSLFAVVLIPASAVNPPFEQNCTQESVLVDDVSFAAAACPTTAPGSFNASVQGSPTVGQPLTFSAVPTGYTFQACDTFSWNFGDNSAPSNASSPTHTYSAAGNYTVVLTVTNSLGTKSASLNVTIGSGGACQLLKANDPYIDYQGFASGCTTFGSPPIPCQAGEQVSLIVKTFSYDFGCANHTFTWNFGDGTPAATGRSVIHAFAASGVYNTTVTINNGAQTFVETASITVAGPKPALPQITVTALPRGILELAGDTRTTDSYTITNTGTASTTVTLTSTILSQPAAPTDGSPSFFSQSPTLFPLAAGESKTVVITSKPLQPDKAGNGTYDGLAIITATGVSGTTSVPVHIVVADPPTGPVMPVADTKRIDLSGDSDSVPSGVFSITNSGSGKLVGVITIDVPWIVPQVPSVTVDPGKTGTVPFKIDHSKRPASNSFGSATGTLTITYLKDKPAAPQSHGGPVANGDPPVGYLTLTIGDTLQPPAVTATSPPLASGQTAYLIPGVGHVNGSGGRLFISDVSIVNRSAGPLSNLSLEYVPAAGGSGTKVDMPVLTPSQSGTFSDLVSTTFQRSDALNQGTVIVRVDPTAVALSANVFNSNNPAGTFGTAIPVFRSDRAAAAGEVLTLTGLRNGSGFHTNLYLQEASGASGAVHVDTLDANGTIIGSRDFAIGPFALIPAGAIAPAGGVTMRITPSGAARVVAYATPLDESSGDTWAIPDWNRFYGFAGSGVVVVPVVGTVAGANGASFRSDVTITNLGPVATSVGLSYFDRSGTRVDKSISLGGLATRFLDDIVTSLFGQPSGSAGFVSIAPTGGGSVGVSSRTYSTVAGQSGTFGTAVPPLPLNLALHKNQSATFAGVEDTRTSTLLSQAGNTFRTNAGLVEVSGQPATVKFSLLNADGTPFIANGGPVTGVYPLNPLQWLQVNGIVGALVGQPLRDTILGDLHNLQLLVEVTDGAGAVMPFLTSTDNGTSDTILRVP